MLVKLAHLLIEALTWFIIVTTLLTFIPPHSRNRPINRAIELLDRLLEPIRKVVPPIGGVDLSPAIAIIVLQLIDKILRGL
ncbi:YggT family protein [Thermovibrio ammonificans]|jgi:YggT family protein|uniref:YggT family protein n=1 Tax=Thermovibrio ammonificans (strain DSM 15698 / JCM 12110 / HB-1) TaxID=648996 RepID=E8T3H4_THEA1|nr:YggT family protein [Thermovibrio ammonificans]ADU96105.1 protein of unknown function YGGT [Thermovibrio ammonificans HB-1]